LAGMSASLTESAISRSPLRGSLADPSLDPRGDGPIRAELFSLERLEAYARQLAAACAPRPGEPTDRLLLDRFADHGRVLVQAHRRLITEFDRRESRSLDAEWLVDNFHIVEDVLREVEHDLPNSYYSELPKLAEPPLAGYPRVFALALALVAHTDSEL